MQAECFAIVREAGWRALGMRHFDVQIMGGYTLGDGTIAEMKTGEGKTLVATLAVCFRALAGNGVHLVTVNDYLARRDADWMGPLYRFLGVTVGVIQSNMPQDARKAAYDCEVTYGTNSEFGFDYLRDNLAVDAGGTVQRGHYYAIVDEVDSILIDEARTPLIISGQPEEAAGTYYEFARIAKRLTIPERLRGRREAQDRLADRGGRPQGREGARRREPLRARQRAARQPPDPVAEGRVALQARRRVRRAGRRGQDRRRVHRPHHGGPPLVARACTRRWRRRRA